MREFWTVYLFELKSHLRKKAFLITTIIILLLSLLATSIPSIMQLFNSGGGQSDVDLPKIGYYFDPSISKEDILPYFGEMLNQSFDSEEALVSAVKEKTVDRGFYFETPTQYRSIVIDQGFADEMDQQVIHILKTYHRDIVYSEAGVDPNVVQRAEEVEIKQDLEVLGVDAGKNFFLIYFMILVIYFLVIMYGSIVSTSVAREKSDRTMELLITSTTPTRLITGKVFAAATTGIFQVALIVLVTFVGLKLNEQSYPEGFLSMIRFQLPPMAWMVIIGFSVVGYLMYLFVYAGLGALVSKVEDVNVAVTPIMIIFMIVYFTTMFVLTMPDSLIAKIASFIPFSSLMVMFIRYNLTTVPMLELVISFSILLLSTVVLAYGSIKIYRLGTLNYGNKIGLIKAIKMSFSKDGQ